MGIKKSKNQSLPFSDSEGIWKDSHKLAYLIDQYENEIKEAKKKGLEAFWRAANAGPYPDGYVWITEDEIALLEAAKDGSIQAIKRLIEGNPRIIVVPFVMERIVDLLSEFKFSQKTERLAEIRKVLWPWLLPRRPGMKVYILDEDLAENLKWIMEREGISKADAIYKFVEMWPFLPVSKARLEKIRVAKRKGRPRKAKTQVKKMGYRKIS